MVVSAQESQGALEAGRIRSRWLPILGYLGGVALGLILLVAAGIKALDPLAFAAEVERHGLGRGWLAEVVAVGALGLEAGLGLALLLNLRQRGLLLFASGLVAFFLALTGRDWWLDHHGLVSSQAACGCFGYLLERTPKEAFLQDLFLLVPAAALAWLGRPQRGKGVRWGRWSLSVGAAVSTMIFAWMAPALPLDDVATRLRPGVEVEKICAGRNGDRICLVDLVPQLAGGRHWIVLADPKDAGFEELSRAINLRVGRGAGDSVHVLAELTVEEERSIFWTLAPMYQIHAVPAAILRPLYRKLPRTFLSVDGRVVRTSSGLDPELGMSGVEK